MQKAIDSHKIRHFQELAMIASSHPRNAQESKLVYWGSLCDLITTLNATYSYVIVLSAVQTIAVFQP